MGEKKHTYPLMLWRDTANLSLSLWERLGEGIFQIGVHSPSPTLSLEGEEQFATLFQTNKSSSLHFFQRINQARYTFSNESIKFTTLFPTKVHYPLSMDGIVLFQHRLFSYFFAHAQSYFGIFSVFLQPQLFYNII